jgi:hypothetical protein
MHVGLLTEATSHFITSVWAPASAALFVEISNHRKVSGKRCLRPAKRLLVIHARFNGTPLLGHSMTDVPS